MVKTMYRIIYRTWLLCIMRCILPAKSPKLGNAAATHLQTLGAKLKARRKTLGISATVAAEAAGMSRMTLHRIERGEPSVTMGAYLGLIDVLGLSLGLFDPQHTEVQAPLPEFLELPSYPQLQQLAWQRKKDSRVTPQEALSLYERNWRHIDQEALEEEERRLIERLVALFGKGKLLV